MISVGIDVSKEKSTVCIMKPGGELLVAPFDMPHTLNAVAALTERLKAYGEEVRVILEATGHYHWPVMYTLLDAGIFTACINALRMKKFTSQNLRKVKTDKTDSMQIAQFGITYWDELKPVSRPDNTYAELRVFARQYYNFTTIYIKAKQNLGNLMDQVMPGIQKLLCDSNERTKLTDFISRYWHFSNILEMGEVNFTSGYCAWGKSEGYRMNERKAKEIFALSQSGIPVLPNTEATKFLVLEAVRVLQELEKSRNSILAHMQELATALPEYSAVLEMGGVGKTLAPRLIAEIGDVRRFSSKGSLIAYAGIDAPPYESGAFVATKRRISKRGNKYLRRTGFEIMQSLATHKPADDPVFLFRQKKISEGKAKKCANIAALNKFLRIYYARVNEVYRDLGVQLA